MSLRLAPLLLALVILAGCGARGPNSPFVPPPLDPEREGVEARLQRLLEDPASRITTIGEYYIGPGDELAISLLGRPDVLGERLEDGQRFKVSVTDSPTVTFPFIGAIKVHGKTTTQLEEELAVAFADFVRNPVPLVTVEKSFQNRIAVLGTVRSPGRFNLEVGDTLLEVIFRAGGLTFGGRTGGLAPGRYLTVYRQKVTGSDRALTLEELLEKIDGDLSRISREEIVIPIEDFINAGELNWNIQMMPGDIVYIPPAGTVFVHGRVEEPGVVFMGPSLRTLTQAVAERGGLRIGAHSTVEVVRQMPGSSPRSHYINIRQLQKRRERDFLLRDGDEIFVYTHFGRATLEFLNAVFQTSVRAGASATYSPQ